MTTSTPKPTIVFVPGSFSGEHLYTSLFSHLTSNGFQVIFALLPSIKVKDSSVPASLSDDSAHVKSITTKLVDEGNDVIIACHSYGGMPMTESAIGMGKVERTKKGKSGGVVGLVYITAYVPVPGDDVISVRGDHLGEGISQVVSLDDDFMELNPLITAQTTFSDVPEKEGLEWVSKMEKHSTRSFRDKVTFENGSEPWRFIPVTYLFCENDLTLPPSFQKHEVEQIEREAGITVKRVYCGAGHCPNVTDAGRDGILRAILEAARF